MHELYWRMAWPYTNVGKRDRENYSKAAYSEADDLCHIAWLAHIKDNRSVSLWYLVPLFVI
jgi:hypothetical protein